MWGKHRPREKEVRVNKAMLKKLKGRLVSIHPPVRELARESRGESPRDIVFRVEQASEKGLFVRDRDSSAGLRLPPDHIREYLAGGKPEPEGDTVGFLHLKLQVSFRGDDLLVKPTFGRSGAEAGL